MTTQHRTLSLSSLPLPSPIYHSSIDPLLLPFFVNVLTNKNIIKNSPHGRRRYFANKKSEPEGLDPAR